jgi:hypothetical protein
MLPATLILKRREKEANMRYRDTLRVVMAGVLALFVGVAAAGDVWAQQEGPQASPAVAAPPPANDSVLTGMAAVAGAIGTFFYIPFKVGIMCPGMALASGASLAVTGGDKATAEYLLRVGCTGTYFITPAMVRGQQEFHEAGER